MPSRLKQLSRLLLGALLPVLLLLAAGPGFRTRRLFDDHYAKHGREFGRVTQGEYLHMAQELRDARKGDAVLEARKAGGVFTRFDRRRGWFGAYNRDLTIRTFFIPNDGERYFRRQAGRDD